MKALLTKIAYAEYWSDARKISTGAFEAEIPVGQEEFSFGGRDYQLSFVENDVAFPIGVGGYLAFAGNEEAALGKIRIHFLRCVERSKEITKSWENKIFDLDNAFAALLSQGPISASGESKGEGKPLSPLARKLSQNFLDDLCDGRFDGYFVERFTEGRITAGEFDSVRAAVGKDKVGRVLCEKYGIDIEAFLRGVRAAAKR